MYIKEFDNWLPVKKRINQENRSVFTRSGEIRWAAIGVNIGSEIDGKGVSFTRPVLILHVIGSRLALVIPMTTKLKTYPGYIPFKWKGKENTLCIHQIRIVSQKRLLKRIGKISDNRLVEVKEQLQTFFRL